MDSGFLEGALLVPDFILQELHYIADSSDRLRRARGRRGLDMLNSLKNLDGVEISIYEDYSAEEVDAEEDGRFGKINGSLRIIGNVPTARRYRIFNSGENAFTSAITCCAA